jgi:hypothetical protein
MSVKRVMALQIRNYDVKEKDYKNKHDLMPQWPFRMLICGASGAGKTNAVLNMIFNDWIAFDKLVVVAKSLDQEVYVKLQEVISTAEKAKRAMIEKQMAKKKRENKGLSLGEFENINIEEESRIGIFVDNVADIPPLEEFNREKQSLVLFDDCILERNQDTFVQFFVRGRHKNISVIYLTQSYFKTPLTIRRNCSHFMLFKLPQRRDLGLMFENHVTANITKIEWKKLFDACVRQRFNFVFIDTVAEDMRLHVRCNFDGLVLDSDGYLVKKIK